MRIIILSIFDIFVIAIRTLVYYCFWSLICILRGLVSFPLFQGVGFDICWHDQNISQGSAHTNGDQRNAQLKYRCVGVGVQVGVQVGVEFGVEVGEKLRRTYPTQLLHLRSLLLRTWACAGSGYRLPLRKCSAIRTLSVVR